MTIDRNETSIAYYVPPTVRDALAYLQIIEARFEERPVMYYRFLDIMQDFKNQQIDALGVIKRVCTLFTGHPTLILGFNMFLPKGYRIHCSIELGNMTGPVAVMTPVGTVIQVGGRGAFPNPKAMGCRTQVSGHT
ncbi:Transcriptional regulatory protein sin3 [Tulasnella sp. 419]|nr:Transcriptional regulatory protein sin3 [Tulasnella sp. 418]KAG8938228.1 Transcriptional regulatory protein sin3 [Tulasnella sp. 419]